MNHAPRMNFEPDELQCRDRNFFLDMPGQRALIFEPINQRVPCPGKGRRPAAAAATAAAAANNNILWCDL